jgi:N-acetylmuramoyl-L-alanine amidase
LRIFVPAFALLALLALIVGAWASEASAAPSTSHAAFHVCIDPGHPSEKNDGNELLNGVREVDVNWEVAQRLKKLLEDKGFVVTMTKSSVREYVTNKNRALIANKVRADLMLRLHADSAGPSGFTLYYPRRQGAAQGRKGPAATVIQASEKAAKIFHPAFAAALRSELKDNGIRGDEQTEIGSKQGALTGSIFSEVPTLLVEMANLAKHEDARWIGQSEKQQLMAQALLSGIVAVARQRSSASSPESDF